MAQDSGDELDKLVEEGENAYFEGDYEEAEELLSQALSRAEALGKEDSRLASILNTLSAVYRATDREEEALEPCKRAFAILEREGGAEAEDLGGIARNVGQIYLGMEEAEESLKWFEKALGILEGADPEERNGAAIAQTLAGMAEAAGLTEDTDKEMDLVRRAYEAAREAKVRDLDARLAIHYTDLLLESDRAEEAVAILESVRDEYLRELAGDKDPMAIMDPDAMTFEMIKAEFQEEHREPPSLLLVRVQLAGAKNLASEEENAGEEEIASLPEMGTFEGRIYGEDSPQLGLQYQELGVALHVLAQETGWASAFKKSELYYSRSLDILKKALPADHPILQQAEENLQELREDTEEAGG